MPEVVVRFELSEVRDLLAAKVKELLPAAHPTEVQVRYEGQYEDREPVGFDVTVSL
jgi:hypothetical protein